MRVFLIERTGQVDQWNHTVYPLLHKDGTWGSDDYDHPDVVTTTDENYELPEGAALVVKPPELTERQQVEEVFGLTGGELSDKPWVYDPDPPVPALETWCNGPLSQDEYRANRFDDGQVPRVGHKCTFQYHYDGVPDYLEREYRNEPAELSTVVVDELFGQRDIPWGYARIARQNSSGETVIDRYEDTDGYNVARQVIYIGDGWGEVIFAKLTNCAEPEYEDDDHLDSPAWEYVSGTEYDYCVVLCHQGTGFPVGPPPKGLTPEQAAAWEWGYNVNTLAGPYAGDCELAEYQSVYGDRGECRTHYHTSPYGYEHRVSALIDEVHYEHHWRLVEETFAVYRIDAEWLADWAVQHGWRLDTTPIRADMWSQYHYLRAVVPSAAEAERFKAWCRFWGR